VACRHGRDLENAKNNPTFTRKEASDTLLLRSSHFTATCGIALAHAAELPSDRSSLPAAPARNSQAPPPWFGRNSLLTPMLTNTDFRVLKYLPLAFAKTAHLDLVQQTYHASTSEPKS
jgi:hypothetical protein